MKVIHNKSGEYKDVINSYYSLESYNDNSLEEVLCVGYATSVDENLKQSLHSYKRKVYINLEAPCSFLSSVPNTITSQNFFNEVYTICPYTANWLNNSTLTTTKYIPIPFPYKKGCFGDINKQKEYDVIYMGNLFGSEHHQVIDVMKKYKYRFCSLGSLGNENGITNRNISSQSKWDLLSKSKISIALNLLHPNNQHIEHVKKYNEWENNKAFSSIPNKLLIPQFKPRIIEAACCKTLNLVMKDDWNIIETWFEPDKDFIYWSTMEELSEKINYITNNFEKYLHIIENAYQKVMQYDIDTLMTKIIKKEY